MLPIKVRVVVVNSYLEIAQDSVRRKLKLGGGDLVNCILECTRPW